MPLAFESFTFDAYDLVISVTSESAKGIITKPHTTHLCYCLTPTRYLWSGYADYFSNIFIKLAGFPFVMYLRAWDLVASSRVDTFIAISQEVQRRIKKYYKKDAEVIYPPLTLEETLPAHSRLSTESRSRRPEPYFLIISRLVGYKRIDIAIQACNELKLPLVIIGTGFQEAYLKSLAGETITFLGNLTDSQILRYYRNCRALIFPGKEDFGLTIVEAQSFGKPVIAYKGGGALETIVRGKTGEFFTPLTAAALRSKLVKFAEKRYNSKDCIAQAKKFRKEVFFKEIRKVIKRNL